MNRNSTPLKVDRHKHILTLVNSCKRITLAELEKALRLPRITVQRDLVELENRKLVRRFHGGAMSIEFSAGIYNFDQKKFLQVEGKKKIAAKANRLLRENDSVCLDGSTTAYYLSETVFPAKVQALTCSIDAFRNLASRQDVRAILAGGRMHRETATLYGPEMVDLIRRLHFDTAFISAEAFIPDRGFFDPHEEEVAVKRALIESSKKTVVMIDSTKVVPAAGVLVCGNDEADVVVTDMPENQLLKKTFRKRLV